MTDRVVLAYSGGLDTSVTARTLREERGLDVVAALVDLGQPFDLDAVRARAAAAAVELHVVDAVETFAERHCLPALHANALYEGKYPLVSALARPLIAEEVVRIARETGARYVAHGCTGKGNDQVRFESSFAALAPDLGVLAPIRESALSRDEALARAEEWGIPLSAEASVYSVDENLWGRTAECGPLEDPWAEPPADAFELTADPLTDHDPVEVVIAFESGRPVAIDGERLALPKLIARMNELAGAHGVGRVDMIENRLVGIKSRELYEVPGALALITAHRDLEDLTLERDMAHEKATLEARWAQLAYNGLWHGPLHASLRSFMAESQPRVTGEVRVRLHAGRCQVVGRRSPIALYDHSLATYDQAADRFDHGDAAGFVRLWSLPLRVWAEEGRHDGDTAPPPPLPAPRRPEPAAEPSADRPAAEPARPLWAARLEGEPDPSAAAFTRSTADRRLVDHDLRCGIAHVRALHRGGLLGSDDEHRLIEELEALRTETAADGFPFRDDDEDVHSAVERVLTERLGDLGARIHAGRSRNDLVVADLRLWAKGAAASLAAAVDELVDALAGRAEEHAETAMPGYTHLQRAQPITLGHHLLAHAFALARDADRLRRAGDAADVSPLGAGALAGTTLPLDPEAIAADLGFASTFENSIDAVSDRDFAVELVSASALAAVHVSRLAEDLVLWCTREFGFATPADQHATGSSMMPQKRNPDVAELARAQAGRILGDLVALATVLKGLPLAYARDLQEDKPAVFDAHDALATTLPAVTSMIRGLRFDTERLAAAAADGDLLATDLAERLVEAGIPFREAHERVAALIRKLEAAGTPLDGAVGDDASVDGLHPRDVTVEASLKARDRGGPSPSSVRAQIAALRARQPTSRSSSISVPDASDRSDAPSSR